MSTTIELGALEGDATKPILRARAGAQEILIEFDSSALQKLAGGHSLIEWRDLIESQRERIRAAAQLLLDEGFVTADDLPRLYITAMDMV